MNQGVLTVIYPVKDLERAKASFTKLLGVQPYMDEAYYVGFRVGNQDIGLDPHGHQAGVTSYYHVDNINENLQSLLDSGAQVLQDIKDVGGGKLIASVKDSEGNIVGLVQG